MHNRLTKPFTGTKAMGCRIIAGHLIAGVNLLQTAVKRLSHNVYWGALASGRNILWAAI